MWLALQCYFAHQSKGNSVQTVTYTVRIINYSKYFTPVNVLSTKNGTHILLSSTPSQTFTFCGYCSFSLFSQNSQYFSPVNSLSWRKDHKFYYLVFLNVCSLFANTGNDNPLSSGDFLLSNTNNLSVPYRTNVTTSVYIIFLMRPLRHCRIL